MIWNEPLMANWCHNYTTITHTGLETSPLAILNLKNLLEKEPRGYYMSLEHRDETTLILYWATKWSPDSKWLEYLTTPQGQSYTVRNVCIELGNHFWDIREGDMWGGEIGGEPDWRVDRHGLTYEEWDELAQENDPRTKVEWRVDPHETKKRFKKDDPDGYASLTEDEIDWIVQQEGF